MTPIEIIGNFLGLAAGSLAIGIAYGLIASYFLKCMRFLTVSSIKETLLIFSFGYLAYATGEIAHMSGIISLLTAGIVMAHYGWYNLSPQGKHVSCVALQVIGFGFEAFVFAYLGLSFFSYADLSHYPWSWSFILIELFICIVARISGTVVLLYLLVLLRHKAGINFRQTCFISYAGMIRGAIAFGLVLKLSADQIHDDRKRDLITTTALTLVVGTTVIFGSAMPLVQKLLVPPKESEKHEYDEIVEDIDNEDVDEGPVVANGKINNSKKVVFHHSEHEQFIHPNAMKASEYENDM